MINILTNNDCAFEIINQLALLPYSVPKVAVNKKWNEEAILIFSPFSWHHLLNIQVSESISIDRFIWCLNIFLSPQSHGRSGNQRT